MSEENEVLSLEGLQELAAEQDKLSGYDEGEHPAIQSVQAIEAMKEVTPKPDKIDETAAVKKEEIPEPEEVSKPEPELLADDGSLKSEVVDERLAKSERRLNETWRNVNSEKESLAEERKQLEELRSSLNDRAKPEQYVDEDGHTAADYEAAAQNFAAEGEHGLAEKAKEQAQAVRSNERGLKVDRMDNTFKNEWSSNFDKASESYPELRDHSSSFRKAVNGMLEERAVLTTYSGGILDAADIVAMQMKAGSSSQLQEQITALSQENSSLKSKLSIGGSDPSGAPSGSPQFGNLSPEEQFAELRRKAEAVDATGGY
jgi:hypothetical protein